MNQQPSQGNPAPFNPNSQPGTPAYPYSPNNQPMSPDGHFNPNSLNGNQQPYQENSYNPSHPNIPQGNQQTPRENQSSNPQQTQNPGQQPYGQQWNAAPNFNSAVPGNQPSQQSASEPKKKKDNNKKDTNKQTKKKGNGSVVGWIFLGIFLMLALAGLGAYLGYQSAISARQAEYTRQAMVAAAEQYQMAIADIEQGKYQNAKTRLDYVIEVDSDYPGAMETYQQVILALYPTASPTPMMTSTPEPTPTKDNRGEEEMFQAIQQAIYSQNWEYAISLINTLRDRDLGYRGLEVDGMYYIALRNYGIQQINMGYLENGVYNITLAEALGPIDNQADSLRNAARSYLAGAGFWEINWSKALEYYSNAAQVMPNMFDRATMLTANQRYAQASFHVGDEYAANEDYCGAIPFYEQGLPIYSDETIQITATAIYFGCHPPVEETFVTEGTILPEGQTGEGSTSTEGYSEGLLDDGWEIYDDSNLIFADN